FIFEDEIGLKLTEADHTWRLRPDMEPEFSKGFRSSIVARSRFVEDLIVEKSTETFNQYVILGAGLDTFAQRRQDIMTKVQLFEVDRAETQAWKRERLLELGYTIPESLHFVPIDFEGNVSLINELEVYGFDRKRPALFAATGVSQYITKGA